MFFFTKVTHTQSYALTPSFSKNSPNWTLHIWKDLCNDSDCCEICNQYDLASCKSALVSSHKLVSLHRSSANSNALAVTLNRRFSELYASQFSIGVQAIVCEQQVWCSSSIPSALRKLESIPLPLQTPKRK